MHTRLRAAIGAFFIVLACVTPSFGMDRVHSYYGQVLDPQWLDLAPRDVRLGVGQLIFNMLGNSTTGKFSNLSVTASGGLYVSVGPSASNEMGSLYQFNVDDANAIGGSPIGATGATQLSADSTLIFTQGLVGSPSIAVGPLTAPSTGGYTQNYLIECQVQTVDQTPQSEQFETLPNYSYTTATVNRDRADKIGCQAKAGTAGTTPVAPTVDTGWIAIANVLVATGASSISQGNITLASASQFYGFLASSAGGATGIDTSSTAQTKTGTLTDTAGFASGSSAVTPSGVVVAGGSLSSSSGSLQLCAVTCSGATMPHVDTSGNFFNNGISFLGTYGHDKTTGGGVIALGSATVGSLSIGANAGNVLRTVAGDALAIDVCTTTTTACDTANGALLTLSSSGNLAAANNMYAGAFTTSSSRKLKRDIHPLTTDPLSVVGTVKPMWFNYRTEPKHAPARLGLIADDTSSVISGRKHDGLNLNAISVVNSAAINELAGEVKAQQREIHQLEARVTRLESGKK